MIGQWSGGVVALATGRFFVPLRLIVFITFNLIKAFGEARK
jgi:hypothetical protein